MKKGRCNRLLAQQLIKQYMKNYLTLILIIAGIACYAQPELGECDQEVEEVVANQIPKALKTGEPRITAKQSAICVKL